MKAILGIIRSYRRHLWLMRIVDRVFVALAVACACLMIAATVGLWLQQVSALLWTSLIALPVAASIAAGLILDRPTLATAAQQADRWFGTNELLATALYLENSPKERSWATGIIFEQAGTCAQSLAGAPRPSALPAVRRPLVAAMVFVMATCIYLLLAASPASSSSADVTAAQPGSIVAPDSPPQQDIDSQAWWALRPKSGDDNATTIGAPDPSATSGPGDPGERAQTSTDGDSAAGDRPGLTTRSGPSASRTAGTGDSAASPDGSVNDVRSGLAVVEIKKAMSASSTSLHGDGHVALTPNKAAPARRDVIQAAMAATIETGPSPESAPALRRYQARYLEEIAVRE